MGVQLARQVGVLRSMFNLRQFFGGDGNDAVSKVFVVSLFFFTRKFEGKFVITLHEHQKSHTMPPWYPDAPCTGWEYFDPTFSLVHVAILHL